MSRPNIAVLSIFVGVLISCATRLLAAQEPSGTNTWTSLAISQNSIGANPVRTSEAHTQSSNRTTDTQTLQRLNSDGRYEPYLDVETETIKVDASTVRTVQRSYSYVDGQRRLTQTAQEESRTLPGGEVRSVRTTSNPDSNGKLQVVQKEVEDTRKIDSGVKQTTTSVFLPDVNGRLSESMRTEELDTQADAHSTRFQKTTLINDGSGNWQTSEVRQGTIKAEGNSQTRDETVSQPDSDGKLAVVRHDVSRQTVDSAGNATTTSETDSVDLPGVPRDGELHPVQRVNTIHVAAPDGSQSTRTQIKRPNPGSPTAEMQISVQTTDNVRTSLSGIARENRTIETFNDVGTPNVVWVDISRSDKPVSSGAAPTAPARNSNPATASAGAQPQPKQ